MVAELKIKNKNVTIDFSKPLDISIEMQGSAKNVNAWYIDTPKINPEKIDNWTGSIKKGANVNFNTIMFNPHAHGTHTECVGHISKNFKNVNKALKTFMFLAEVITVAPESFNNDLVISKHQIEYALKGKHPEALVIRTLPNTRYKISKQYSNTNWAYLTEEAAVFIRNKGIQHLLIDLPSIDKEKDNGKLLAHKAFWNYPKNTRENSTITEFIYVPNKVEDGDYILNLQIASFKNDASPSKPILYKIV